MIKDYRAALDEGRHLIDPVITDYQSKFSRRLDALHRRALHREVRHHGVA